MGLTSLDPNGKTPLHRSGDIAIRLGTGALAVGMATILLRFLAQGDTLLPFTVPMVLVFLLFGWFRPVAGTYPLIFALPLVPLVPHMRDVGNFSLAELGWWALCLGRAARHAISPRPVRLAPVPSWPLLTLLTIAICGSATVRLLRNHLWSDPIAYQLLWQDLGDFFRWKMDSRLHPIRAAIVWLEGVAFLNLIRRGALRDEFQRRVRTLLVVSLTFVILISLHQLLLMLRLGVHAPSALAPWQLETDWIGSERLHALHGTFPDVNSFASYLLMALPLVLSIFMLSRNVFARAILLLLGVGNALVLGLTFSRIAWIWLPVAVLLWVLLNRRRARGILAWINRSGPRWVVIGFLIAMAALWIGLWSGVAHRSLDRFGETGAGQHLNVILKGRMTLWERALREANRHPLLGSGWGSFYDMSFHHHRAADSFTPWGQEVWNPERENAHNQYLQVLAETGVLGLALTLMLVGHWALMGLRVLARGSGERRWMVRGLMTSVAALGGTLLTGHALLVVEMLFFFMVVFGLAMTPPRARGSGSQVAVPGPWSGRAQVAALALVVIYLAQAWSVRGAPGLLAHGTGLYAPMREPITDVEYQWTGDRAAILLRNIQGECAFLLSNARPDQQPVTVEVYIDGELRERVTPPDYHWWPYRYEVYTPPNAVYRLDLRVLHTFRNDFDPEDKILGIRMRIVSY